MAKEYSIYDAKAHLSDLVRRVRETGQSFVITVHGKPAAELRPIELTDAAQTLEARVAELTAIGAIIPAFRAAGQKPEFPAGTRVPGALQRFLEDRD